MDTASVGAFRAVQSVRYQLAAIPDKPQNHEIVGRDELISSIKTQLLKRGKNVSIALQGGPGVGKTAIAVELAHDPEIEDYFQGGILWAGIGKIQMDEGEENC